MIDISRLLSRMAKGRLATGVDRVNLAYVGKWGHFARAVVQMGGWRRILSHAHSQTLFDLLLDPPTGFRRRMRYLITKACLPPWPVQDAAGRPGFYLGHSGMESSGFHEWIRATRQRPVYFIHDLIPITHAEYCRAGERGAHERRLEVMLSPQSGLISNSKHTLDLLRGWAHARDLPVPPSVVAPLAPARLMAHDPSEPPLQRPYFVILGTIEPRKNHLLLLNIWRELARQCGASTPHLVVIGQRGWECENVVDMLERCTPLQPFVHEVPACHDLHLARYLRHAQALLFPSFAEGYGMPLVEALMLGTPVIASDLQVFREIAGEVPEYLNPLDAMSWIQAVADYTGRDSVRRSAQLERMRNFQVPSWDTHFAQVEQLLAQMA